MFERYTDKARRVVFFARYEASQSGSREIGVAHLLLGLMREDKNFPRLLGLDPVAVVPVIRALVEGSAESVSNSVDMPLSTASKRVLAYAAEEAGKMSHKHIGTEHIWLGVLREDGREAAALVSFGVRLVPVREAVLRSVAGPPPGPSPHPVRQSAHDLLARIPEDRLKAAHRLLSGLTEEFFTAEGASAEGAFRFSFGPVPPPQ
jgi:ATP-dependent Clp protease ATP-binding subunit ClpC